MRRKLKLMASATCLALVCGCGLAFGEDVQKEVHLVSIYEGFEQTGNMIHGPKALVHVDRPGKNVTLVLTSYSGATWHVTSSKDTRIQRVILGGYAEQAVEGVPKSAEITKAWRGETQSPLPYSYRSVGPDFRRLVKQVNALTKNDPSSFHGEYAAKSNAPFLIDKVQTKPELAADYPRPTPLDKLPADARELKFFAHHYVAGKYPHELATSFGQFTIAGPVEESLKPLPKDVHRIAHDSKAMLEYGITWHEIVRVDKKTQEAKTIKLGLDVPRLHWPCDITYDSKRQRIILGSSGYLYAYLPDKQQWSVISKRPRDLAAFVYSPKDDCLYGVLFEHAGNGQVPSLAKLNAEGAVVSRFALGSPIEPGSLNAGPGVTTTQVAIVGDYIAILAAPGGLGDNHLDAASIYLVDPESEQVWLTAKKVLDK